VPRAGGVALGDERLLLNVQISYDRSGETYGAPRVHQDFRAEGLRVGKKRVARLMRDETLVGRRSKSSCHLLVGLNDCTNITALAAAKSCPMRSAETVRWSR
jgi:transposase InsO family protein